MQQKKVVEQPMLNYQSRMLRSCPLDFKRCLLYNYFNIRVIKFKCIFNAVNISSYHQSNSSSNFTYIKTSLGKQYAAILTPR